MSAMQPNKQSSKQQPNKQPAQPAQAAQAAQQEIDETERWDPVEEPEFDGWYQPDSGDTIQGRINGFISMLNDDGQPREIVAILLEKPCSAVMNKEPIELGAGQTIGVSYRSKLGPVFELDRPTRVRIKPTEKIKLKSGGRTMWKFKIDIDPRTAKHRVRVPGSSETPGDLPF